MTWEEWMESDYKPTNMIASKSYDHIVLNEKGVSCDDLYELLNNKIKENIHYILLDFRD